MVLQSWLFCVCVCKIKSQSILALYLVLIVVLKLLALKAALKPETTEDFFVTKTESWTDLKLAIVKM